MQTLELPTSPGKPTRRGLLEMTPEELNAWLQDRGHKPMRARQLRRWIVTGRARSFEEMTDLPLTLREQLEAELAPFCTTVERELRSIDGTVKQLTRLHDGHRIESVLLPEGDRRAVCVSTQVGCGMGCVFCASGIEGVVRNLTPTEILEQLLHARNLLPANERISHIVVMGMGEPLANLDNLMEALEVASSPQGLGISARHITVSTVGLPTKIRQFADWGKQYHLAVSLHAPNDALRNRIVPTNDKVGLADILEAADYFYAKTGRQVTYEYVLLRDLNDRPDHAGQLARLLRGRQSHVNLIPFNDVEGLPFQRISQKALADFLAILHGEGIVAHVRKRKGADIDAACGQLRRDALKQETILVNTPAPATAGTVTRESGSMG